MIVLIEGPDRTGKDFLIPALNKKINFGAYVVARGPVGVMTYDEIYSRKTPERDNENISLINALKTTNYVVAYMTADKSTIEKRLQDEGTDFYAPKPWTIYSVCKLYTENIYKFYDNENIIQLNSSTMSVEQEVEIVAEKIEEIKSRELNLTGEVKNIFFRNDNMKSFKSPEKDLLSYNALRQVFTQDDVAKMPPFNPDVDKTYYDMILGILREKFFEYKQGWINKRNIIYTNDSCISLIQFVFDDKENLSIFIHQRSYDIAKQGMNDITFLKDFIEQELNYKKYTIYYSCGYPHKYVL